MSDPEQRVTEDLNDQTTMRTGLLALLGAAMLPAALSAQAPDTPAARPAAALPPSVPAVAITQPLRIDGRLDEAAWAQAKPITEFTQLDPSEGQPASERTEARILFDGDALYVGVRLHDAGPVTRRLGRRDMPMGDSDWLTVILDSYHDHQTAFGFEVNPAGVRRDQTRAGDREDNSWDPVWDVATTVDDQGWTAEMRIPFSQLRFAPADVQTWGLQIERTIGRKNEFSVFSFTPKSERGGIARFGHLEGLRGIRTGKRLEVLPYTVARAESVDRGDNPFRNDSEMRASVGLDLKYRVTSNLTLDATVNPDFGQVEIDPAVINLSAFETFYQEKRPFFVEGASIFDFGRGSVGPGSVYRNLFYSRRVGRAPQLRAPTSQVDAPSVTRILGAAKLTGKVAGGWSIGIMEALTQREEARFLDPAGATRSQVVEPQSNYFVARASREMRAGQSSFGGMFTAVNRNLSADYLQSSLRSDAYAGGLDFRHEWARRAWSVSGYLAGTQVLGEAPALLRLQRSSARYFQRPDAGHVDLDPQATSMGGYAGQLQLRRSAGRHWLGDAALYFVTPGYEANDMGFQSRADQVGGNAQIIYQENKPGDLFRSYRLSAFYIQNNNLDGDVIGRATAFSGSAQFKNYWGGFFQAVHAFRALDDRLTWGGPLAERPAGSEFVASLNTDQRKPVTVGMFAHHSVNDAGSRSWAGSLRMGIKSSSSWNLSVGPELRSAHSAAQYVTTVPDALATSTFGRRHLFAELEQTTLSLDTRFNVTFSPGLSLQMYAQPFIASGRYGTPVEFAAPRNFQFRPFAQVQRVERAGGAEYRIDPDGSGPAAAFTAPDRSFNLSSLRGNAVLRWEWRPGSTLYVAWQQNRAAGNRFGDFILRRDVDALFTGRADNVLVVKMNYWLNP